MDITAYQTILSFFISLLIALILIVINGNIEKRKYLKREHFLLYKKTRDGLSYVLTLDDYQIFTITTPKKDIIEIKSFEEFKKQYVSDKPISFAESECVFYEMFWSDIGEQIIPKLQKLNDLSIGKTRRLIKKILPIYTGIKYRMSCLYEELISYNPEIGFETLDTKKAYIEYVKKNEIYNFSNKTIGDFKKLCKLLDNFIKP
jgi:hypothetical protein